ncbi:flagellar cap protein [Carnobacterium mobile]|uniref:flagellar cap protein n=1 Tax=Carnobacterium mobile TaxID=2750 RepID=UPI001868F144|nr:flagellar cap protein [Carnobacterium mobile]
MQENEDYLLRMSILKQMTELMESWDNTAASAERIIIENKKNILLLRKLDSQSSKNQLDTDTEEETIIKDIIQQQEKMVSQIKMEQKSLLSRLKQLNQKDKVRDNYVSVKRDPIFINKGL